MDTMPQRAPSKAGTGFNENVLSLNMEYPGQIVSDCLPILIAMRRIQFIELHEQPWFPPSLRNEITDALQCGSEILKAYAPITALLQRALDATRSRSIVDVCSGGGGPWLDLSQKLRGGTAVYRICLTDKFPNLAAFENVKSASAKGIDFYRSSVDATKVPVELDGFRTMFSSFHHFPHAQARAILQNAVDARQGIGIFEITSRTTSAVGMMFLWFLTPFVFTPSIRPFRWSRLLYTYVLWRWGLKLAERGGKNAKKRAVIAVARKLAVLLHKLWVSGGVYESLRNNHKVVSAMA
jgi:hypothetical protein